MLWWHQSRSGSCRSGGGESVISHFQAAIAKLFESAIAKLAVEINA